MLLVELDGIGVQVVEDESAVEIDPDGLANPGKVLPTPRLCGEVPGPYRMHPLERIGVVERF